MFGIYRNQFLTMRVSRIRDGASVEISKLAPDGTNNPLKGDISNNESQILRMASFLQDVFNGETSFEQSVGVLRHIGVDLKVNRG